MHKERFPAQRHSKLQPRGDGPFQVIARINDNAYKLELPGDDLRTNPFEERGNDGNQDDSISTTSCDPLRTQGGPVTRARAKMREALNGLIEQIWVENNIQQANRSLDDYQGMAYNPNGEGGIESEILRDFSLWVWRQPTLYLWFLLRHRQRVKVFTFGSCCDINNGSRSYHKPDLAFLEFRNPLSCCGSHSSLWGSHQEALTDLATLVGKHFTVGMGFLLISNHLGQFSGLRYQEARLKILQREKYPNCGPIEGERNNVEWYVMVNLLSSREESSRQKM
ncbi:hypothetical protein SLEP1_g13274 [Rubroshorea leprosula]|uniref:Tf2-1-like SH3-like domain-containing protein n=1 Tax=Rubroshorea leprosula TaxID=152421 RepID=A0AAV5IFA2_9ROSI|nr:hypothetical protein SLEP1_g13274 [Rubroshorea leprosula]